jgi:hypothetical protein
VDIGTQKDIMLTKLRHWLAGRLRGAAERLASIGTTEVRDRSGWETVTREIPTEDRQYVEWAEDIKDALEAWRRNPLVRQIVRLTTNYVVGDGIGISSEIPTVDKFIREWWSHPMNQMDLRLEAMCDELTRAGELFPVLFTNEFDRMTYVRFIPARQVNEVETDKEDLERELRYHRLGTVHDVQGTWWKSRHTAEPGDPLALHYAINRAIGCVRGEGDLLPILPWAKRYTAWLKDRVRLNRARVEGGLWDVTIEDETKVEEKRKQYGSSPPEQGSVIVHGPQEKWQALDLKIDSGDAKEDGKVIRLAVATGAGIPLHFMSEGESATKATAAFMGGPTFRHYRSRQEYFCHILSDIISQAYRLSGKRYYSDLRLVVTVTDIEERDNKVMAESAKTIVEALATMKGQGWVTDEIAISLAFKFAGEILSQEEIKRILEKAPEQESAESKGEEGENEELSALRLPELIGGNNGPGR